MQNTFFATDKDLLQIVQWFLEVPGMILFEPTSRPGRPNRQFCTDEDIAERLREPGLYMNAWLEPAGARPYSCYNEFSTCTELRTPAAISIQRDNAKPGALGATHITCWNEQGAKQRSLYSEEFLEQVNWKIMRSIMGHFRRKVRKASPATLKFLPIMEDAFARISEGSISLWHWGMHLYPSPHIELV